MKKSNRSKSKHAALDRKYTLKLRQDYLDYDYADKLVLKTKEWLNKFTEEDLHASIKEKPLHKTKKQRKAVYDRNNERNRDLYNRKNVVNDLVSMEGLRNVEDKNQIGVIEGRELKRYLLDALDTLKESKTPTYNSKNFVREFIEKTEIKNLNIDTENLDYAKMVRKLLRSKRLKNLKKF